MKPSIHMGAIPLDATGLPVPLNKNLFGTIAAADRYGNCYVRINEDGKRILRKYAAVPVYDD